MANTLSIDAFNNNLGNPARTYIWRIIIPNPLKGDSETYTLRAASASQPERSFGSIHIPFKQSAGIKFPGKISYSQEWEVVFWEGEDRAILEGFYDWMNEIINDKYLVGSLVIKVDMYLHLLNQDHSVAKRIKLIGCYPQRLGDVSYSDDSEDNVSLPVTFSFDRWELLSA